MKPVTTYVRTNGGKVVHLWACRHVKASYWIRPWPWAEGMTPDQIAAVSRQHRTGLSFCGTCFPDMPRGPV